jgi:hypothetical protein
LKSTKSSAAIVAHDVAGRLIMADVAPEGHGQWQWPWRMMPMVSGRFGFTKKIGVMWNSLLFLFWVKIFHTKQQ